MLEIGFKILGSCCGTEYRALDAVGGTVWIDLRRYRTEATGSTGTHCGDTSSVVHGNSMPEGH
ncbi:hypothetical protein [Mycobacterium interjectum]|uniref:hypothetical protein n=1 Tax=Mycobacterium interjectum TaxID=33895 RepID=UPI000A8A4DC4|nr:hypothetical protein [Mycobacterium interjectum]MCV7093474.1 hypothetical protein [Mycobacterium interjectum]